MFAAANHTTVSNSLLAEVASSGIFPDPALFVYSVVLGTLVVGFLLVGYVICGRSARPTRRLGTPARAMRAPVPEHI
ncbi:MAG: hypothetical protein JRD94_09390 [Deltaproteobacteria bacterium]|nr:hypothetical protein [Deltaproteobacteria bacterium]